MPQGWPAWWRRRGATARALLPLAWLFGVVGALRRYGYRRGWLPSWRAPLPVVVIVIGNVTVGGSGKTPLVLFVARALRAAGLHPGIVSRGYRRAADAPDPMPVLDATDARQAGDEPLLLRRQSGCPVWVGRRRAAVAAALLAAHPEVDVLLADDGLQHYALQRDVELVVVDARGAGNGWLLPAGPLRERWTRRRDATLGDAAVLATLSDDGAPRFALRRRLGGARHLASGERVELLELQRRHPGCALDAAAGIGDPRRFFDQLRDAGVALGHTLALPDHAAFDADPLAALNAPAVLVTEKDALKCAPGQRAFARVWAVELELDADPAFLPWLLARCAPAVRPKETVDGLPPA